MYVPYGLALPLEQLGNQIRAKEKEKAHTETSFREVWERRNSTIGAW
jgi:hypothetical protein